MARRRPAGSQAAAPGDAGGGGSRARDRRASGAGAGARDDARGARVGNTGGRKPRGGLVRNPLPAGRPLPVVRARRDGCGSAGDRGSRARALRAARAGRGPHGPSGPALDEARVAPGTDSARLPALLRDARAVPAARAAVPAGRHPARLVARGRDRVRRHPRLPRGRPAAPHPLALVGPPRAAGGEGVPRGVLLARGAGARHLPAAARGARGPPRFRGRHQPGGVDRRPALPQRGGGGRAGRGARSLRGQRRTQPGLPGQRAGRARLPGAVSASRRSPCCRRRSPSVSRA